MCPCTTQVLSIATNHKGHSGSLPPTRQRRRRSRNPRRTRPPPPSQGANAPHHQTDIIPSCPHQQPTPATVRPNYWDALGLDSNDDAEFRSDIDLAHPQEIPEVMDTPEVTEVGGLANLDNIKHISNHYSPSECRLSTHHSAPRRQHNSNPSIITFILATAATKAVAHLGHCRYKCVTIEGDVA